MTIAFGIAAGLLGSLVLTRFLQSMLFSVKPTDPGTFATLAAFLAAVTFAGLPSASSSSNACGSPGCIAA